MTKNKTRLGCALVLSLAVATVVQAQDANGVQPGYAPQAQEQLAAPPPPPADMTQQPAPTAYGQWVLTQHGWVWVPAGATSYAVNGLPYAYLFTPSYGWSWYASPWGAGPFAWGSWISRPWPRGFYAYRTFPGYRYGGYHRGYGYHSGWHRSGWHGGGFHGGGFHGGGRFHGGGHGHR